MKYKITNPTRRTYIVQGHQLKCGESIELDEIKFTEPSLVVEKIESKHKNVETKSSNKKSEVRSLETNGFEKHIGEE